MQTDTTQPRANGSGFEQPPQPEQRRPETLRPHEHAALLPPMSNEQYRSFRADVERRGLLVPLEINADNVILDGLARLRAAHELGLKLVPVRVVRPDDELEYALLAAIERRQLSASQRAALAVDLQQYRDAQEAARKRQLANLRNHGDEVAKLPPRGKTRAQAAAWASVSPRTVQDAASVRAADPELFEQIRQGRIPADRAARRVRQRERDKQLPPPPPLPSGPFELIYADPPWRLPGSPDSSRAIENHYATMEIDQILAMRVPAADKAALYLWAVPSMVPEALQVMAAWGFSYRGEHVWIKDRIGLGAWNRNQHEPLLVGVRGDFKPPAPERRFSSVITAPRRKHSEKPAQVYELLELAYPNASRLELFARGTPRPGWVGWGNETSGGETE